MGGWKASGLGSRHGPDGIRKYTKRQSILVTPATRRRASCHMFPYSAQVTEIVGQTFALLATSDLFTDEQRRTLAVLCDTLIPSLAPPEGEDDPRLLGAPATTSASPRRWRRRCSRPRSRASNATACAACLTLSPARAQRRRPAGGTRGDRPRDQRRKPGGARRHQRDPRADPLGALHASRPRHRP